jgi:uncharacterized protein (DUF1684 family)
MVPSEEESTGLAGDGDAASDREPPQQSAYIFGNRSSMRTAPCLLLFFFFLHSLGWSQQSSNWTKEELLWREHRASLLLGDPPHAWLSVIGLDWLTEGASVSVGSASDNTVRVEHCSPHLGVFHLNQGKVILTASASGFPRSMQIDGQQASVQTLRPFPSSDNPSIIKDDSVTIYIFAAGNKLGLSIWDSRASAKLQFHGLQYFPPDPNYVIHAHWIPYTPPRVETHTSILGIPDQSKVPGVAEFVIEGKMFRVEPLDRDETSLQFPLADRTNGATTYGGGRYLLTAYPSNGLQHPGEIVLNMNRLYNPPCAFTHYVNCTLAPAQNRLTVAINAGEKKY